MDTGPLHATGGCDAGAPQAEQEDEQPGPQHEGVDPGGGVAAAANDLTDERRQDRDLYDSVDCSNILDMKENLEDDTYNIF